MRTDISIMGALRQDDEEKVWEERYNLHSP